MTKTIWTGVCTAVVACATAAIGQTTSAPQSQSATASADKRITVIGCLKQAPPSAAADTTTSGAAAATGTAGTTGSTAGAGSTGTAGAAAAAADEALTAKFLLTNASASNSSSATGTSGAATAGTTGTTGTTGTSGTAATTGTTATSATETSAAATAPPSSSTQTYRLIANPTALSPHVGKKLELTGTLDTQSGAAHATGPDANAPALKVESGKVIAASCSQ